MSLDVTLCGIKWLGDMTEKQNKSDVEQALKKHHAYMLVARKCFVISKNCF